MSEKLVINAIIIQIKRILTTAQYLDEEILEGDLVLGGILREDIKAGAGLRENGLGGVSVVESYNAL